jgi:hypothetical protein
MMPTRLFGFYRGTAPTIEKESSLSVRCRIKFTFLAATYLPQIFQNNLHVSAVLRTRVRVYVFGICEEKGASEKRGHLAP